MKLLARILAGLAFGLLAGLLISHSGLGIIFLAALFVGAALISLGLGPSRLLVAIAIWVGQYVIFYWRFIRPASPTDNATGASLLIIHSMFVFLPGMVVFLGAYVGLLAERMKNSKT
ncbi:MAG TPA: hypothetical protein VK724_15085 [Bryobacteraceae bacterium]|nr:hypothetical protein [Bryobacteraceae bacterium]